MPEDLPTLWDIMAGLANDQKRLWELVLDTRKATLSNVDVLPENQKRLIAVSAMGIALAKMDEMTQRLEVKFAHVNARLDRLLFYAEGGEPDGIQYRCDWCKR